MLTIVRTTGDDRGDPEEETRRYGTYPYWADEIADFTEAIKNDTRITNGTSEDALNTMRLVYRIYCTVVDWKIKFGLSDEATDV